MRNAILAVLCLSVCTGLTGCVAGYNSVFFATKSNLGVDLETATPAIDVGIQRKEGVIEPVFEGGQTLPVMASFSSEGGAIKRFVWGASSTFSTGDAAQIMSYLYDAETPQSDAERNAIPKPPVTISQVPDLPIGLKFLTPGKVKPVAFATDTSLGFKVAWSGATAQYPSSVHLGFKRKEAAWTPVGLTRSANPSDASKPIQADIPSLLATVDFDVNAAGSLQAGLKYLQYFATGQAATNLAMQKAVRKAMIARSDPVAANLSFLQSDDEGTKELAIVMLNLMFEELKRVRATDPAAAGLISRLNAIPTGPLISSDFFKFDQVAAGTPFDIDETHLSVPTNPDAFDNLLQFHSRLALAKSVIDTLLLTNETNWRTHNDEKGTDNDLSVASARGDLRAEMFDESERQRQRISKIRIELMKHQPLLADLVAFYYH